MQFFRNTDIAKQYKIDESTVRKWISRAREGKLDLVLHEESDRIYIANTARNVATIKEMIEERRKYRNTKAAKIVRPRDEFYRIYSQAQIYDLVTSLELHHEIPRQYNYFNGGAASWDEYAKHLAGEDTANLITSTIKLLDSSTSYMDDLLGRYKRVNVVDIGVGNALPVKSFLERLISRGVLGRYIAIDISAQMLEIARRNIKEWFGDTVHFESYELDINQDRFSNILAEEYLRSDAADTANLALLLGGTPYNFRNPDGVFKIIHDSMGVRDYLITTTKLDTDLTRRYFDFNVNPGNPVLPPIHRYLVDLLNIDPSLYELELGFDEVHQHRYERIRFKTAVTIEFEFDQGKRTVEYGKGEAILVWRFYQQKYLDIIHQADRNDFTILHSSQTLDQEYVLTVSRAKVD